MKTFSFHLSMIAICSFVCGIFVLSPIYAQTQNDELVDVLERLEQQKAEKQVKTIKENLSFDTFSSCENLETTLETFIEENYKDTRGYGYGRGGGFPVPMMAVDSLDFAMEMEEDAVMDSSLDMVKSPSSNQTVGSSTTDFSTTNTQVEGVDEADIIKTDGEYIYYYNQRMNRVSVLRSPLNTRNGTITLSNAEEISTISVPESFHGIQMYIQDDKLVLLAQRRSNQHGQSFLDRGSRTDVIVYDITTKTHPKLLKFSDLDGNYHDSRMIGNTLYVVSQIHMNWWHPLQDMEEGDTIDIDATDILPKTIDISYTKDTSRQELELGGKIYPYAVDVQRAPCDEIQYILPSKESMKELNLFPSFTVVRAIDIDQTDTPLSTTTAFGNTHTIHMSQKGLYLTNPLYIPYARSCPANARCILPWYDAGQHTLIHKFALSRGDLNYVNSNVVQGNPISQYSMDEDSNGNFRILTSARSPNMATHFFVLDPNLDLEGFLLNIEPGEEFKSSRYIGDKLYLVTFERTDPLFVIDIENTKNPRIIGELKIPGYSTYLHPYAPMKDGKQYLLGLGYDTGENQRGGIITKGIKLDLYEIDYNDTDPNGYVGVSQVHSEIYGGKQSQSEALHNPRMFVWDEVRKLVVLPMILTKESEPNQRCEIVYDSQGNEVDRECWEDDGDYTTAFAGLKALEVDIEKGITQRYSYDFIDMLKRDTQAYRSWNGQIYPRQFNNLNFRVGYAGDVLYTFNNLFAHFAIMGGDATFVPFDEEIFDTSAPIDDGDAGECRYIAPGPNDIVCEMYCGQRWVAEEGTCLSIEFLLHVIVLVLRHRDDVKRIVWSRDEIFFVRYIYNICPLGTWAFPILMICIKGHHKWMSLQCSKQQTVRIPIFVYLFYIAMKKLLLCIVACMCIAPIFAQNNDPELEKAVTWMYEQGLTRFGSVAEFYPQNYLTREQAAKFYAVFMTDVLGNEEVKSDIICEFADAGSFDQTLALSIDTSCELGLFKGASGYFYPRQALTKAQALTVLVRALEGKYNEDVSPWRKNYFVRAQALGLTKESDVWALDRPVYRYEVALMLYRSANGGVEAGDKDLTEIEKILIGLGLQTE